jgi:hypothetical protein
MHLLERVKQSEFLGREFLVWLWFRSETQEGRFDLGEAGKAELWFDGKITLQSDGDEATEIVTCAGENSELREARFALTENKKVTQALIKLTFEENTWSFVLDSTWINFRSFKAPKVIQDKKEDPEGLFYEKVFLIDQAVSAINTLFSTFIKLRVSQDWQMQELPALLKWIHEGK